MSVEADLPRACDLRFEGVSADLTSTGFRGPQQYRTVSGDVVLDRVGGDVRIKGVSSDVSIRADETLPALDVSTVSGDISAVAPRVEQLRLATVSGDVELETSLADGPQHRVETVSGDLALGLIGGIGLEVRGVSTDVDVRLAHRSEGTRDRRRYVVADGGASLLFSSMSGDVQVYAARRAAPLRGRRRRHPPLRRLRPPPSRCRWFRQSRPRRARRGRAARHPAGARARRDRRGRGRGPPRRGPLSTDV